MKQGSGPKGRSRGRNGGGGKTKFGGNRTYDGGGRSRAQAQQLMEKFLGMARDAAAQDDRVQAEYYYQHSDHYYRICNADQPTAQPSAQPNSQPNGQPTGQPNAQFNQGGHQSQPPRHRRNDEDFSSVQPMTEPPEVRESKFVQVETRTVAVEEAPAVEERPKRRGRPRKVVADEAPESDSDTDVLAS